MSNLREFRPLQAPFIKVEIEVTENAIENGKPKIKKQNYYKIAPSAKKIATYIVNQILGSDLIVPETDINWLMPTLQKSLEQAIYSKESFIYLHKFDNKVYLENIKENEIFDLVQKYDKIYSGTIIEEEDEFELRRRFVIEDGKTYLDIEAYEIDKDGKPIRISLARYNSKMGTEYKDHYILPYEIIINIDTGRKFFKDSIKLLNAEMKVIDVLNDEIEKTKTKVVTTQHFQTGNIATEWKPYNNYNIQTLSVGKLQDYFTLLPGDKEHYLYEFEQGDIRVKEYVDTFKFYDYQIIQMAGLSPATFGYEKDSYMNEANVDLSANASEMTIEAIKTQITNQINKLFENIVKMQTSQGITENVLPNELEWNYGSNERITDLKKLQLLKSIQNVAYIPYEEKAKILSPLLEKLLQEDVNEDLVKELVKGKNLEKDNIRIEYGEL